MQKFVIVSLVLSLSLPLQATAANSCNALDVKQKCEQALKDADTVIQKQGVVVQLTIKENQELRDENKKLDSDLLKLKELSDDEVRRNLYWGSSGVLVGIILTLLVHK